MKHLCYFFPENYNFSMPGVDNVDTFHFFKKLSTYVSICQYSSTFHWKNHVKKQQFTTPVLTDVDTVNIQKTTFVNMEVENIPIRNSPMKMGLFSSLLCYL